MNQINKHLNTLKHKDLEAEKRELLEFEKRLKNDLGFEYAHPLFTYQREFIESTNKMNLLVACNQGGKLNDINDLAPTPDGFKRIGDFHVGDLLYDENGNLTRILAFPFEGKVQGYKVTMDDNSSIIVGENHRWYVKGEHERFRKFFVHNRGKNKGQKYENPKYGKWKVKSTLDLIKEGNYDPETIPRKRFSIPICKPVKYPERKLPLDPYVLGVLLGDGSLSSCTVRIDTDKSIVDYINRFYDVKYHNYGQGCQSASFDFNVKYILDTLGLIQKRSHEKFIPEIYKIASIEQRKALLSGLLDTDGYCSPRGDIEYCTTSEQLKNDIIELINSLGGVVNRVTTKIGKYKDKQGNHVICKKAWRIFVKTTFNPFILKRKAICWKKVKKYKHERIIYKIEPVGEIYGRCFTVDSPNSLYLTGKDYIVNHNTSASIIRCCKHMFTTDEERVKLYGKNFVPGRDKLLIWYFYPSYKTANTAFKTTWQKYLPKGIYLEDEELSKKYGWKANFDSKHIDHITFRDGILEFKAYEQSSLNLQMASVYEVFTDEELPFIHYPEIRSRMNYTNGIYNMVFTATLGEDEWYRAMEKQGEEDELFPNARKWNVSLWDLLFYEDGTKSHWTKERIIQIANQYGTPEEVERRVNGRFVMETSSLVYSSFSTDLIIEPYPIPQGWQLYCGIDIGSGGKNHKSAISFVAVSPDKKEGVVFACWRGEEEHKEKDVLDKYKEFVKKMPQVPITFYDHSAKDFIKVVEEDSNFNMHKAEKSVEYGNGVMNSLMKNKKLKFFNNTEMQKLFQEFRLTRHEQPKRKRKDDLTDSVKFGISRIQWDWSDVRSDELIENKEFKFRQKIKQDNFQLYNEYGIYDPPRDLELRRQLKKEATPEKYKIEQEFDDFNDNSVFDL
jgi:hypothetical protein